MEEPVAGWLGIDVGWVYPAADSTGQIFHWSTRDQRRQSRGYLAQAGDVTVTKADGTTYTMAAYGSEDAASIMALADGDLHERSLRLASTIATKAFRMAYGVALEDFRFDDRNRQKRWQVVQRYIRKECEKRGVPTLLVGAAYTSQTCPECGHRDKANRPTRNRFDCQRCPFQGHADRVAARNISNRAVVKRRPEMPPTKPDEKRCTGCRVVRPHDHFNRMRSSGDGLTARCALCLSTAQVDDQNEWWERRRIRLQESAKDRGRRMAEALESEWSTADAEAWIATH